MLYGAATKWEAITIKACHTKDDKRLDPRTEESESTLSPKWMSCLEISQVLLTCKNKEKVRVSFPGKLSEEKLREGSHSYTKRTVHTPPHHTTCIDQQFTRQVIPNPMHTRTHTHTHTSYICRHI